MFGNPFRQVALFVVRAGEPKGGFAGIPHTTAWRDWLAWNDRTIPRLVAAVLAEAELRECPDCECCGYIWSKASQTSECADEVNGCLKCGTTGTLPGTGILDPARLGQIADAVDEACGSLGVVAPEEVTRHLRGWVMCCNKSSWAGMTCLKGDILSGAIPKWVPCLKCHGTGWLRSTADHVVGCFAVEMLKGEVR